MNDKELGTWRPYRMKRYGFICDYKYFDVWEETNRVSFSNAMKDSVHPKATQ
jgi:hypothetical protein